MAACGDDNPPPLSPTTEENDNFYEDLQAARKAKWAAQEADCDERGGVWVETYVYPGEIDRAVCTGPGVTVEFSEEND